MTWVKVGPIRYNFPNRIYGVLHTTMLNKVPSPKLHCAATNHYFSLIFFLRFYTLPHLRGFILETDTHLIIKIDGDIGLESPALAPKWLQMSHGWPKGPSPRALSFYGNASPADPGFVRVVPHTINLLRAIWDRVRSRVRDLRCISATATRGIHYAPSKVQSVALVGRLPLQLSI